MTAIHTLHTTIQFPTPPGDDVLPDLHTLSFLWPDLSSARATWGRVECQHPLLHPLIEYAADALEEEQCRRHYERARTFHQEGTSVLAAQWTNVSIQGVITTVHRWMDVAGMLAMVERDAPELAGIVHPLLERVGREQQRLLTLLAVLQGIYFTYCQSHHVLPTLVALSDEEDEQDHDGGVFPQFVRVPDDSRDTEEVQR